MFFRSISDGAPPRLLVGRYHEITLKGRNRWRFVEQLRRNIRAAFAGWQLGTMRGEGPRILVGLPADISDSEVIERAGLVFGLQNFSISRRVPLEIEAIKREAIAALSGRAVTSFAVRTRRSDKRFPMNSMEIDREVGRAICETSGLRVNLTDPEVTVSIELLSDAAYVSVGKIPGAGGLPVGVAGRALALLSGGIDSPVAAWRMMRRGLRCDFIHFHSYPLVSSASREKAADLAAHLTRFQGRSTLTMIPFAAAQRAIVAHASRPLRVVLYRRFMMRIASAVALRNGAETLVTGESLGQVASQTLANMTVIEKAAGLPILRPLLGMDKNEIIQQARVLGTFETSIIPDQDCCSLFVPAHPETRARLEAVEETEHALEVERLVADSVAAAEEMELHFGQRA
jgi:thiamine biosynthesis protein ThiI